TYFTFFLAGSVPAVGTNIFIFLSFVIPSPQTLNHFNKIREIQRFSDISSGTEAEFIDFSFDFVSKLILFKKLTIFSASAGSPSRQELFY
ncbi:MAG: hypothetical protein COW12_10275, partial [Candidatus Omnitrophica bacterium CG12_big_fil_rev_8_21_14_0_65_45_16]